MYDGTSGAERAKNFYLDSTIRKDTGDRKAADFFKSSALQIIQIKFLRMFLSKLTAIV